MRDNTAAIIASPEFSQQIGIDGKIYGNLKFSSTSALHAFSREFARTPNEKAWRNSGPFWCGLGQQSIESFDATGKADYPLTLTKSAIATMEKRKTKPGVIRNTVTGGVWDIPSVLSGLPLAARSRIKSKLTPLNIRIFIAYSAMISAEEMAPISAKISSAIWEYILSGGAVTLTVFHGGQINHKACNDRIITETRVNTSDISAIALALSPACFRAAAGPILTASSNNRCDAIYILRDPVVPNCHQFTGVGTKIHEAAAAVIESLKIS